MRVRQHAYLSVRSRELTPEEISDVIGARPNSCERRGARKQGPPPVPASHWWRLDSGLPEDCPLQDHVAVLWLELATLAEGVASLRRYRDTSATVTLFRQFEDGQEDFDVAKWGLEGLPFERLAGQHPFLGFGLDAQQLRLLVDLDLEINVAEYG